MTGLRTRKLLCYGMMMLLCATGCLSADGEHDEHADHEIPAHKPEHFVEAIEQLSLRSQAVKSPQDNQELSDIVGWLPELAAQTDLPKSDWDRIHELTLQWQMLEEQPEKLAAAIQDHQTELDTLSQRALELDTSNSLGQKVD